MKKALFAAAFGFTLVVGNGGLVNVGKFSTEDKCVGAMQYANEQARKNSKDSRTGLLFSCIPDEDETFSNSVSAP